MYLEKIKSPDDIKEFSIIELEILADEIRHAILQRDSLVGGHVGPNLGIVEATIALHYVFHLPHDKFVFDVSHQSYPHKMLTGRAFGYTDPQRMNEVSGYSSPTESPLYDTFELGHTSTSISLATGLQKARDLRHGTENIVAIIGDGSLGGGEALEGLNEAAELGTGIVIVLNDNEMSIAENHGGLYRGLQRLRQTGGKDGDNLFRAMGLDYIYVDEGNDIEQLISAFSRVKNTKRPVVVHIHTLKGKGYALAEQHKERWHYSMPFDIESGELKNPSSGENYSDLTAHYLLGEMQRDPLLVAVTSGTPTVAGFTAERRKIAGRQFVDVGIAEEQAVAMISGMAKGGLRPVYNVYSTFLQRTYDQLAQDLAINRQPALINVFLGSIMGMNDIAHIGFYDIAMLSGIPGIVYLAPTCWEEYRAMMEWGIRQTEGPVAIRVPGGEVRHDDSSKFPTEYSLPARFSTTHRGTGVAIIAAGAFYHLGTSVALQLKEQHSIDATLINPRYLTHLDEDTLRSLCTDHHTVVTLEDGALEGGFGEKVARFYGPQRGMRVLCHGVRKGLYDRYDYAQMFEENGLTVQQIVDEIMS